MFKRVSHVVSCAPMNSHKQALSPVGPRSVTLQRPLAPVFSTQQNASFNSAGFNSLSLMAKNVNILSLSTKSTNSGTNFVILSEPRNAMKEPINSHALSSLGVPAHLCIWAAFCPYTTVKASEALKNTFLESASAPHLPLFQLPCCWGGMTGLPDC